MDSLHTAATSPTCLLKESCLLYKQSHGGASVKTNTFLAYTYMKFNLCFIYVEVHQSK